MGDGQSKKRRRWYKKYLKLQLRKGADGTHVHLTALADTYGVNIIVHTPYGPFVAGTAPVTAHCLQMYVSGAGYGSVRHIQELGSKRPASFISTETLLAKLNMEDTRGGSLCFDSLKQALQKTLQKANMEVE